MNWMFYLMAKMLLCELSCMLTCLVLKQSIYISVILEISSLSRILVKIRIENKLFVFIMMQCYWGFDT